MLRSSPRTLCQCEVATRFFPRTDSTIWCSRSCRCGGREMVMATVSMSHPSTTFCVSHLPSPLSSFLTEMGSRRPGRSCSSFGRRTASIACISTRRTRARRVGVP